MSTGRHTTRSGGKHARLHAKQDCNVVAHASMALLAAIHDLVDQAGVEVVFATPLADRYALVLQPGFSLGGGAEFFHRMV